MKKLQIKFFLSLVGLFLIVMPVFSVDYYQSGKEFYYKKNYPKACQYLQKAVSQKPLNVNYRYYYAQTLVYTGDFDRAQSEYSKIIEISPDSEAANLSVTAMANIQKYYNSQNSYRTNVVVKNKVLSDKAFKNDNYLENAVSNSGDIFIWNKEKMPVKVYLANNVQYTTKIKQAFEAWKKASKGQISYKFVSDKKLADILIEFKKKLSESNSNESYMAGVTNSHPTGNYLENATITFSTLRPDGTPVSSTALYNCALHEIGHSLGIQGHSSVENDIMYPVVKDQSNNTPKILSKRDINTINDLYSLTEQDLITSSESNKLGNKNERLKKKLQEALDYVKKVPNEPISWTQLGLTYMSCGDYNNAIINFQKALSLDPAYKSANEGIAKAYAKKNEASKEKKL
jgi:tetratricopeptide (TPR) repeat protein